VADVDARALAHTNGRMWVGGRGTLGWIDGTDTYQRVELPLQDIHALSARGDTLWIGAETGLLRWMGGTVQGVVSGAPALDVTGSDSGMIAITTRGVQIWNGSAMSLPLRNAALQQIGRAVSLASKGNRVWVGGTHGLAEWNTTTGAWRYLTVPDDIPEGPVYDVLEESGRIWLATPAGALRMNWK
jgi:ligand-binding sensor domain-containing protein